VSLAIVGLMFWNPLLLRGAGEQRFNSPEEAVQALRAAAQAADTNAFHQIFGPEGHELVSPDVVERTTEFTAFVGRLKEKVNLVHEGDDKEALEIGNDGWPFPIPLRKQDGQWSFDTAAGREEILNRRIGGDELGTIAVCHAYVNAQREYAAKARNGGEVLEYAQHLRSTPGTHDGLYWPAHSATDEMSPLGPLIAQARGEGYRHETRILSAGRSPYHGYYFKVLTRQGKHAPAGSYKYVINGHMIAGFALVAWPEQWGNSGIMTFIVNQQGKVYEKNLGPKTASLAEKMSSYDPDSTWSLAEGR